MIFITGNQKEINFLNYCFPPPMTLSYRMRKAKPKEHPENPFKRVGKKNKQHKVMKTKHLILFVAFLGMYIQGNAQSKNGPSLEETLSFINMKSIGSTILFTKRTDSNFNFKGYVAGKITNIKLDRSTNIITYFFDDDHSVDVALDKVKGIQLYDNDEDVMFSSDKTDFVKWDDKQFGFYCSRVKIDAPKVLKAYKHLFDLLGIKLIEDAF